MEVNWKKEAIELAKEGMSWRKIARELGVAKSTVSDTLRRYFKGYVTPKDKPAKEPNKPRILVLDIETKPMLLGGWGLFNQNFSLEQIEEDWQIISYSSKWYREDGVDGKDITEVTEADLLMELWNKLDEADFVIAHNGRRFDLKKIRARMITQGFKPYSPVRVIDTLEIVKKEFAFTSNKLAYLTRLLCKSNIKSSHNKFPGYVLWKEFLKGNVEAINEMRDYNNIDVESLEELYDIIAPWSSKLPVFEIYHNDPTPLDEWEEYGYHYSNLGKYQRYRNVNTGQFRRGRVNLLSKEKRASLLANIV